MSLDHPFFDELWMAVRHGDVDSIKQLSYYLRHNPEVIDSPEDYQRKLRDNLSYLRRRSRPRYLRVRPFVEQLATLGIPEKTAKQEPSETEQALSRLEKLKVLKKTRYVIFLGAGASKPKPSSIPTVAELLPELWARAEKLETRPLDKLQTWCTNAEITNIEDLLTALTISNMVVKKPKIHSLFNSILYTSKDGMPTEDIRDRDTINSLQESTGNFFSLLVGTMLDAKPNTIHKSTVDAAASLPHVRVVTTNYDACLEQAFDAKDIAYSYIIDKKPSNALSLVKMHGSINWYYCDVCQHIMMPDIEKMKSARENKVPYPLLGMCTKCRSTAKQFIVPPTNYKYVLYPPIVEVWDACRTAFDEGDIIIIVGYSFGDADDYIAKMLLKSISEHPDKKVIICDTDKRVVKRFKQALARHVSDFSEENYFPLIGKAEDLYVRALEFLTSSTSSTAKKGAGAKKTTSKRNTGPSGRKVRKKRAR